MRSAKAMFAAVLKDHLIYERPNPDEWADRYRIIIDQSPIPGRWSTSIVPYMREPLRDYADRRVRRIVLMWAAQVGKTETMINMLMYSVDCDPYPSIWVTDSKDSARNLARKRLLPSIRSSPRVARHLLRNRHATRNLGVEFDSMTLSLVGSNSAGQLASQPAGRLFMDERDKFPAVVSGRGQIEGGAVELAYKRLGAFGSDAKAVEACTPTIEDVGIHAEYLQSDQAKYFVPCPHCGEYQILRFGSDGSGGVRWEGGSGSTMDDVSLAEHVAKIRMTAWYECQSCGGRIENSDKRAMLGNGLWVRRGQEIKGGVVVGTAPATDVRGYQLSSLYSPFQSFGDVAAAFVKLRGEPTQDFVNSFLGEPWRSHSTRGNEARIMDAAASQSDGIELAMRSDDAEKRAEAMKRRYAKGEVPCDALVLLVAFDVQEKGVYYEVTGWGERESRYLIDWGYLDCPEVEDGGGENWGQVDAFVSRAWPRVGTGEAVSLFGGVIDSGFRTNEVYSFCLRHSMMCPVKGQDAQVKPIVFSKVSATGRASRGKVVGSAEVDLMSIAPSYWKNDVFSRMNRPAGTVGAWHYPIDFCSDDAGGIDYARQLTAEERVIKRVRGRDVSVWAMRPGRRHNHYLDLAVYSLALAEHYGLRQLTRESVSAPPPDNPPRHGVGIRLGGIAMMR